jgi:hypothetical protein
MPNWMTIPCRLYVTVLRYLVRTVFSEYENHAKSQKEYFKTYTNNSKAPYMSRTGKLVFFNIYFVYWCDYFQYD